VNKTQTERIRLKESNVFTLSHHNVRFSLLLGFSILPFQYPDEALINTKTFDTKNLSISSLSLTREVSDRTFMETKFVSRSCILEQLKNLIPFMIDSVAAFITIS